MDKKFIKDEFEKMVLPEVDVRENVLNSIHGDKPKRRKRFRPKAVVALALTLIMATGVVFGAGKLINVVVEEPAADEIARYKMNIGVEGIKLGDEVSEKLLGLSIDVDDLEVVIGNEHFKKLNNYHEVEDYLEISLLQSPILNNSFEASSLVADEFNSNNYSNISISANSIKGNIAAVSIDSLHRINGTDEVLIFGAYFLTPIGVKNSGDFKIESRYFDHEDNSESEVLIETYTSEKSGITAEIVEISERDRYSAYFELDSIVYTLATSYGGQVVDPRELIIEVIDSFER